MKRKAMMIVACMMMVMNTIVFLYLDKVLKQDISVYVVQVGRYEQEENANKTIEQLKAAGYEGYSYDDKDIVVIAKIFLKQEEAHELATELSKNGMTCVVKEYLVDQKYEEEINSEKYDDIYKEFKS